MMLLGLSLPEAQRPIGTIVAPMRQTIVGCWNVRTMAETTWAGQVAKEMKEYGIEVLGISEARWKGKGFSVTLQSGEKVVYVANDEVQQGGVAIMMSAGQRGALMEWMPISKRIITAQFYSKYKKLTVIQAYTPTKDAMDEEKGYLYNQLQYTLSSCKRIDD